MTSSADVGQAIVNRIAGRLGCEPDRVTHWRHGLTWYPGGLTQHVWVEETPRDAAVPGWRVQVRTWCLKRVVASSHEMVAAITAELAFNNVSALIRKPGSPSRLGVGAAILTTADRVDWTSRLMAAIARLQALDAVRMAQAQPVRASGAVADLATDRLIEAAFTPRGAADIEPAAPFETLPFVDVAESLRSHDGVRAIATHSGITASFPWGSDVDRSGFILLEMRVGTRPEAGPGVWASMSMPMAAPAHLLHALTLNEAELATTSPTDAIGGWIVRQQTLVHETFLPLALCGREVVRHLAESAARRAAWLRLAGPSLVPGEWPDDQPGRVLPFRRLP